MIMATLIRMRLVITAPIQCGRNNDPRSCYSWTSWRPVPIRPPPVGEPLPRLLLLISKCPLSMWITTSNLSERRSWRNHHLERGHRQCLLSGSRKAVLYDRDVPRQNWLQLRNKTPKRRVKAKLREDRTVALQVNETWAMDFVHDQLATGRKIRILTVVDTYSRFSPAVDPRFSYRGEDVVLTLERICGNVGYPKTTRARSSSPEISTCGLSERRYARLLAAGQADGPQLHRVIQRQVPLRVLEHALVHEP
ncbi:hypothetical protein M2281_005252 [Mesorhizobium soli]|nr:hypothetical protein [Mesorhizobium soli]